MAAQNLRKGFSDNPLYDELMRKLGELDAQWRGTKSDTLVQRYHHVLFALMELGWTGKGQDALDVELELPDELMPPEYFQLFAVETDTETAPR